MNIQDNNTKLQELPFYFTNDRSGNKLFGVQYLPKKSKNLFFILLQPLGIERNVVDAVQVNIARALASKGISVLRFDYFGTGDSEGSFSDITLKTLISDVEAAINYLKNKNVNIELGIFGLRFGAFLASLIAERLSNELKFLILGAPIVNAEEAFMMELRQSISTQAVLFKKVVMDRDKIVENIINNESTVYQNYDLANINGFPLTRNMLLSVNDVDIIKNEKKYKNSCLIINIDKVKRKNSNVDKLMKSYSRASCIETCDIIEKTILWVHGTFLVKNSTKLNNCIIDWIEKEHGKRY